MDRRASSVIRLSKNDCSDWPRAAGQHLTNVVGDFPDLRKTMHVIYMHGFSHKPQVPDFPGLQMCRGGCGRPRASEPARHRFPGEVIAVAVRWCLRYGLSYHDVEELLAERGIEVDTTMPEPPDHPQRRSHRGAKIDLAADLNKQSQLSPKRPSSRTTLSAATSMAPRACPHS